MPLSRLPDQAFILIRARRTVRVRANRLRRTASVMAHVDARGTNTVGTTLESLSTAAGLVLAMLLSADFNADPNGGTYYMVNSCKLPPCLSTLKDLKFLV
jgi:hypothetical protein